MGNPFKTPEFKKLFKKWNNILEETGHNEIENFALPDPPLMQWESQRWSRTDDLLNTQKQQYYEMAEIILETFEFKNKTHRRIWALHCTGISGRRIAKLINRKGYRMRSVYSIIVAIEIKSGLKRG